MKRIIRLTEGELKSIINQTFLEKIKSTIKSFGLKDTAQMMGVSEYDIIKMIGGIPEGMNIYEVSDYLIHKLYGKRVPTNVLNDVNLMISNRKTNWKAEYKIGYKRVLEWTISFTDINGDDFTFSFWANPSYSDDDDNSIAILFNSVIVNDEDEYEDELPIIGYFKKPEINTLGELQHFLFNDFLTSCREVMDKMIIDYVEYFELNR